MKEYFSAKTGTYYRINEFQSDRPTLVFVHGLTGSSSAWVEYEKRFDDTYNILTYDLRGHGKSSKFKHYRDYEIKKFAEDLHDLIKELQMEKFTLISHSFGTVIALEFLRKYQDMALSAIFLSPIYSLKKGRWSNAVFAFTTLCIPLISKTPMHLKKSIHIDYSKYKNTGDWNLRRMVADTKNTGIRIFVYCLSQEYRYHHGSFWGHLTIPVLIVHGKNDTISPVENALIISRMIKNSRLVLLDKTNHIIVLNNFNEVSVAIEEFVSS